MDPRGHRPAVGGLSRRRRQRADPRHRRLPFSGDQLHAAQPQQRRRQAQPAHAGQSHRLLHSGRSARRPARRRHEGPGWRRRLLSDLRLAVRASRRRQRPRLAADDARAARQAVPGRPHGASAAGRQSAAGLSPGAAPISSAASAARRRRRSAACSLRCSTATRTPKRPTTTPRPARSPQLSAALQPAGPRRPAPLWPRPRRRLRPRQAPAVQAPAPAVAEAPSAAAAAPADVPGRVRREPPGAGSRPASGSPINLASLSPNDIINMRGLWDGFQEAASADSLNLSSARRALASSLTAAASRDVTATIGRSRRGPRPLGYRARLCGARAGQFGFRSRSGGRAGRGHQQGRRLDRAEAGRQPGAQPHRRGPTTSSTIRGCAA